MNWITIAWPMVASACIRLGLLNLAIGLVVVAVATHAQPSEAAETNARVKRVLVLDSFGREFSPFNVMSASVQKELARQSPTPVEHHEATIEAESFEEPINEQATAAYLRGLSAKRRLDVIITVGGPATVFAIRNRQDLLADVPLVAELEQRRLNEFGNTTNTVIVPFVANLPGVLDDILHVLPATTNIVVILGASPLEQYWVSETRRLFASHTNRLSFTYLNDLTLETMCGRVAALPPHSAVLYVLLMIDSAGVPHQQLTGLTALHAAANAPIFSLFEHELGMGIVGGRLTSMDNVGQRVVEASLRILKGEPADGIKCEVIGPAGPVYDWRELRRWGIRDERLPAGTTILFRPPTLWSQHRSLIITVVAIILVQAATIAALLAQRSRRRYAETTARTLGGRLINAQEDERRRIARDLHDDLSQRLALMAVELDMYGQKPPPPGESVAGRMEAFSTEVRSLSSEVHQLAYELHPAKLDQLGLVAAARALCKELSAAHQMAIEFDATEVPSKLPPDVALGLYRILQEALHNSVKHSGATTAKVRLFTEVGNLYLTVADDGRGFDPETAGKNGSLGILSMRERARMLGGQILIDSHPGDRTRIEVRVPMNRDKVFPEST